MEGKKRKRKKRKRRKRKRGKGKGGKGEKGGKGGKEGPVGVHSYMGAAPEAVGTLNVIVYTDTTTGGYVGLDTVQTNGASSNWYDNVIMGTPDHSLFDTTPYCEQ